MNISDLTESQAKKLLADLNTWPDVAAIIYKGLEMYEAADRRKAELLQFDQNLADRQKELEKKITEYDKILDDLKFDIKQCNGYRGAYIKKLNAVKANREAIHKEWVEKFANK